MRPEDIREHIIKQPFVPFRIHMPDGTTFTVEHPDMCLIGRSSVYVVMPNPKQKWMFDRLAHCSLLHINRIEPVNGRNGQKTSPSKSRKR